MRKSLRYLIVSTVLFPGFAAAAAAGDCEAHAASMVAEMQAARREPLSASEIALIRETALKSCTARKGDTVQPDTAATTGEAPGTAGDETAPAAVPAGAAAAAGEAPAAVQSEEDEGGFWRGVARRMKTPYHTKEGNERLKRRGTGQL